MIGIVRSLAYWLRTRPALGRWALHMVPDVPWTLRLEGIGPFRLRLRRNRSLWLRKPLESERFPFAMLQRLVRPGDVVYDCGANLGLYARHLTSSLGAGRARSLAVAQSPGALRRPLPGGVLGPRRPAGNVGGPPMSATVMPCSCLAAMDARGAFSGG